MDIDELQHSGRIQLLIFGAALVAASIATAFAITNPGTSRFWVGGFVIAGFSAYRILRIYFLLFRLRPISGTSTIQKIDWLLIAVAVILTIAVANRLLPEYMRVVSPTIGTCWAELDSDSEKLETVACWSDKATLKSVEKVSDPESCPFEFYVKTSPNSNDYLCLDAV